MITLAFFFLFLFCICILCCFLTQKAPFRMLFFWCLLDSVRCYFLVLGRFPRVTRRGHHREVVRFVKMLRYPPSFMSLPCIFCKRMHLQYIEAFLVSTLGLCPKPQPHFVAPQGQAVKTQPPDPVAKCWVGSKASRVKCTASPPLTPLHLRESSKTIRSGRSWKPVKACEATACGLAFTGWRRPNALW